MNATPLRVRESWPVLAGFHRRYNEADTASARANRERLTSLTVGRYALFAVWTVLASCVWYATGNQPVFVLLTLAPTLCISWLFSTGHLTISDTEDPERSRDAPSETPVGDTVEALLACLLFGPFLSLVAMELVARPYRDRVKECDRIRNDPRGDIADRVVAALDSFDKATEGREFHAQSVVEYWTGEFPQQAEALAAELAAFHAAETDVRVRMHALLAASPLGSASAAEPDGDLIRAVDALDAHVRNVWKIREELIGLAYR